MASLVAPYGRGNLFIGLSFFREYCGLTGALVVCILLSLGGANKNKLQSIYVREFVWKKKYTVVFLFLLLEIFLYIYIYWFFYL